MSVSKIIQVGDTESKSKSTSLERPTVAPSSSGGGREATGHQHCPQAGTPPRNAALEAGQQQQQPAIVPRRFGSRRRPRRRRRHVGRGARSSRAPGEQGGETGTTLHRAREDGAEIRKIAGAGHRFRQNEQSRNQGAQVQRRQDQEADVHTATRVPITHRRFR